MQGLASFCSSCCCMHAGPAKRKPIYQAAIYHGTNQPDNLQLCLLPGWATLHSSPTARVKPQLSAKLSYSTFSELYCKSLNNLKDFKDPDRFKPDFLSDYSHRKELCFQISVINHLKVKDPETAKWNSAISDFNIYTFTFSTVKMFSMK